MKQIGKPQFGGRKALAVILLVATAALSGCSLGNTPQNPSTSKSFQTREENPGMNTNRTAELTSARQDTQNDEFRDRGYSKSFRNKTRIENPQENWAVFRDVHEPIIDRETFERVQQIVGKVKQRHLKNPEEEKCIFTNLLYCADCGSRMWFHKSTNKVPNP